MTQHQRPHADRPPNAHVAPRRVGRNHVGLCPFHAETGPSFNVTEERCRYRCFGCGANGDVIELVQEADHVDFVIAVETLASAREPPFERRRRVGVTSPAAPGPVGCLRPRPGMMCASPTVIRDAQDALGPSRRQPKGGRLRVAIVAVESFAMPCDSGLVRMALAEVGRLVHESGMVMVGERHGTNEFPNLVLGLAAAAAGEGRVVVALELGEDARDPTAAFLHSAGTVADRHRLLTASSWQRDDGRASEAMFSLVDRLRAHVQAGASIDIEVFDATPIGDPRSGSYQIERERLIAENLLEIRAGAPTLALSGNVHAELIARPDARDGFVPASALVAEHTSLVSLVGRHAGGASCCTLPIDGQLISGAHHVAGSHQGDTAFIEVGPLAPIRSGTAYVGPITPSPPAAQRQGDANQS